MCLEDSADGVIVGDVEMQIHQRPPSQVGPRDLGSLRPQAPDESASDEARGACHENVDRHALTLPSQLEPSLLGPKVP